MFLWWIGDHPPRHVYVFDKNGKLTTRVNLGTMQPMAFHGSSVRFSN